METTLIKLQKNDKFEFNKKIYTVRQKFGKLKKEREPYLLTTCGKFFYMEDLVVKLVTVKTTDLLISAKDINKKNELINNIVEILQKLDVETLSILLQSLSIDGDEIRLKMDIYIGRWEGASVRAIENRIEALNAQPQTEDSAIEMNILTQFLTQYKP